MINFRSLTETVPFIDCKAASVPDDVVWAAVEFAARVGPDCDRCKGTCRCGGYMKAQLWIIERYLRNWDRQRVLKLMRCVPFAVPAWRPSLGARLLLLDGSRDPRHRRPEPAGFEIDAVEGERWRRFAR